MHGIFKTVDDLGRMVLPKELRDHLDVELREKVELIAGEDCVIIRKYRERCVFCRASGEDMLLFMEQPVCVSCLRALRGQPAEAEAGAESAE
jgi:transcriptional pleiotropic regulator of transition state genes